MLYKDTRDGSTTNFRTAVLNGMNPATGGLYIPVSIPKLDSSLVNRPSTPSFRDLAVETIKPFVDGEIPEYDIHAIIQDAYDFNPKLKLNDRFTYVLELSHGPTCAFKDFGARFMARTMSYFNREENDSLHILVATSGDTGSAVGSAFSGVEGVDVTILYPKGKISQLQEKQLSTFTGNVRSLAVDGTFDDCQRMVKTAFTDVELRKKFRLSSANSINISRLLPQSFYYTWASIDVSCQALVKNHIDNPAIIMVVPSGNFGNLTSGLIAKKMGAPIRGFVAATNSNHTIPDWIATGRYSTRPSVQTLSNAMDVGTPSNYERIASMYSYEEVCNMLASYWLDDKGTNEAMNECFTKTGYTIDPHGAIAWKAWNDINKGAMKELMQSDRSRYNHNEPGLTANIPEWADTVVDKKAIGIVLETADPAKFGSVVKGAIGKEPPMPEALRKVLYLPNRSHAMTSKFADFKEWLMNNL